MKLIIKSKELDYCHEINYDKVHIFTQFFIPSNNHRYSEIKYCLQENEKNTHIDQIHLLNEKIYSSSELGIQSNKIIQTNIQKRLTFENVFSYIRENKLQGYFIMLNSDICVFKHSLTRLKQSDFHLSKQMCALLRYECNSQNMTKSHIFGPRADSQDAWIFHSNFMIPQHAEKIFSFEFGKPGCDNKMIYLMSVLGYNIINDPQNLQIMHVHSSKKRPYSRYDAIHLPVGVIIPASFQHSEMKTQLGIDLKKFAIWSNHFQSLMFDDNKILHDYISSKLMQNQHFIIPRISGIENNVAVFAHTIHQQLHHDIEPLIAYIKKTLPAMKNNAGIKLSQEDSVIYYSNLYLSAFDHCDLLGGWEPQGDYIGHIAQSHAFMQNYYKNKQFIWAYVFDIFHYIYNQPWTQALKGKRILLISPFQETLQEQIIIRKQIYDGVDLFPDCKFITLKPPQTQADQRSAEFAVEFDKFKTHVDEKLEFFDVALVSCGGYANPICSHIYSKGKSAIYVGGVLQMYFGILGNRWIKERPDIVKLFYNKHWKRPKMSERPLNYNKVENGCYW